MLRKIVLASGAVSALALAMTGCSSSSGPGHATAAKTTAPTSASSNTAAASGSSNTASETAPADTTNAVNASSAGPTTAAVNKASAGGVDVCSLLTPAQASKLNKVTYGATTAGRPATNYQTCTYKRLASVDPVDIQNLTVTVVSDPSCWAQLESAEGPGTPIPGVGDGAFGYGIGIEVKAGNRCLDISGLTAAELFKKYGPDIAMAKIILGKLG